MNELQLAAKIIDNYLESYIREGRPSTQQLDNIRAFIIGNAQLREHFIQKIIVVLKGCPDWQHCYGLSRWVFEIKQWLGKVMDGDKIDEMTTLRLREPLAEKVMKLGIPRDIQEQRIMASALENFLRLPRDRFRVHNVEVRTRFVEEVSGWGPFKHMKQVPVQDRVETMKEMQHIVQEILHWH